MKEETSQRRKRDKATGATRKDSKIDVSAEVDFDFNRNSQKSDHCEI